MTESLLSRFGKIPDIHQNPLYAQAMQHIGWKVLGKKGSYLYLRKLGPLCVAKIQHPKTLDLAWLKQARKENHILTTYVEPGLTQTHFNQIGFKVEPFANSKTALVDLTLSPKTLLSSFKQKTRYNINLAIRKKELKIVTKLFKNLTSQELSIFQTSRQNWSKRKHIIGYEENFILALIKSFADSGYLHFAYHHNDCVATLMILQNKNSAIYYAAFSENLGYHLYAPTLLTWTAITNAQKQGCTIFDFGGIYDERYKKMYKNWQGFTKFKEGFSPTIVYYPPTQLLLGW